MNSTLRLALAVAFPILAVGPIAHAQNSWPVARHDPQRTAFVPGATNITTPGVAWRYYLGGALSNNQYWAGDIDGSGQTAVVYVGGGKVIAKHADDTVVWESPQLALSTIVDVWDVDGDGNLDVVVAGSPDTVAILSGLNGSLEWTLPASAGIGTLSDIRTADVNGDGVRDLYLSDCGECTVVGANGAVAFSFVNGFAAAQELWGLPQLGGSTGDLITDVNGDGVEDILRTTNASIEVFSGQTGAFEFESAPGADGSLVTYDGSALATPTPGSGAFVIFFQNSYAASANLGGFRVLGYAYEASLNTLARQWEVDASSPPTSGAVQYDASSIGKFDSSGRWEVAFSLLDSTTNVWTLEIVDAVTGAMIASQPGAQYQGAADIFGTGIPAILAAAQATLTVFTLSDTATPDGGLSGTLKAGAVLSGRVTTSVDRSLAERQLPASPVATTLLGGNNDADVVVITGSQLSTYEAVDLSGASGAVSVLASFEAPTGASYLGTNIFSDPSGQLQPVLALSSGYLAVLNPSNFSATNLNGSSVFPERGIETGGYYSGGASLGPTPVVGNLDAGVPSVVVAVSSGALVRLDPGQGASAATPPNPTWSLPGFAYPSMVDVNGDGVPEVVARAVDGGTIFAYEANGQTVLWSGPTNGINFDLPFGDANGDGVPDIFYEHSDLAAGFVLEMNVLDGRTGQQLWNPTYTVPINSGMLPMSVGDMNGDGNADAISATNYVTYLSGPSGAVLAMNPAPVPYGEPLVLLPQLSGLASSEAYIHGGYYPPELANADAGIVWTVDAGAADHWTEAYAAIAPCDGGLVFVEGEYASPVLHAYSAQSGAEVWREVLASGQEYPTVSAVPSASFLGSLGNVTVKQDLTGTGHTDALVGSTDGYLYAIQACGGGLLDWVYDFGYPVGEPIVADTTGTGRDQVLVSVADGYLYALQQASIQPPGYVYAVDPPGGYPHSPVSMLQTVSTLYAEWAAVPGAISYEWAVYTSAGAMVGMTAYQTVGYAPGQLPDGGLVVDLTASGLPLVDQGRYYFAVRAVNDGGPSGDELSNVVTVEMEDAGLTDAGLDSGVRLDAGFDAGTTVDGGIDAGSVLDGGQEHVGTASDAGTLVFVGKASCCGCTSVTLGDFSADALGVFLALGLGRRRRRVAKTNRT